MDPVSSADDLIRRAQTGDHRAFTMLLRACDRRTRSVASGLMGTPSATDDALQDAYLLGVSKARRLSRGRGLFHVVAHHRVSDLPSSPPPARPSGGGGSRRGPRTVGWVRSH